MSSAHEHSKEALRDTYKRLRSDAIKAIEMLLLADDHYRDVFDGRTLMPSDYRARLHKVLLEIIELEYIETDVFGWLENEVLLMTEGKKEKDEKTFELYKAMKSKDYNKVRGAMSKNDYKKVEDNENTQGK